MLGNRLHGLREQTRIYRASFREGVQTLLVGLGIITFASGLNPAFAADQGLSLGTIGDVTNYDCHDSTFAIGVLAPHYSLLLRYDNGEAAKIIGDLASSWEVSGDGLTYTFKLRDNVRFHDGSALTSNDVRVSYERIKSPPEGVVSPRRGELEDVASIETPDERTVVFKLAQVNSGMLDIFASPYNCIYSSALLASDPEYPKAKVMGTGPFKFVDYQRATRWRSERFDQYFLPGLPHLARLEQIWFQSAGAMINAIAGAQIDGTLQLLSPSDITRIKQSRGESVQFPSSESITLLMVAFNSKRAPFDDERVRRALLMAIDREGGLPLMLQNTNLRSIGGIVRPGYQMAQPAEKLGDLSRTSADMGAAREEARKLLADAGALDLKIKLVNRNRANPWQTLGVFVADQWRQIGLDVELEILDDSAYVNRMSQRDFDVALDFNTQSSDHPSLTFVKYVPGSRSNFAGYEDDRLTALFSELKAAPTPEIQIEKAHAFENRLLEKAYVAPLYWASRTAAMPADLKGWISQPSYYSGWDLVSAERAQ